MNQIVTSEQRPKRYHMRSCAFLCEVAEGGVILDLTGNRYIGLNRFQMQALSMTVQGWPAQSGVAELSSEAVQEVAEKLIQQQLLTEDASAGKDATPIELPPLEDRLFEPNIAARPDYTLSHLAAMASSCASAGILLNGRSLAHAVSWVQARKQRAHSVAEFDVAAARKLTQIFYWLRPLFYTARKHCLYDSLVFMQFMARHELFPTWVIGVKAFAPFSAHSWVQYRGYALSGPPDWLKAFVPVLAV